MSAPDIPSSYTITSTMNVGGALDMGLDDIRIKEVPTIELKRPSPLNSSNTLDLGPDDIHIKDLPKIDLRVEIAMKPTRVHFPVHLHFCLSTLGMELLAFSVCGESMVVIEDYVPHKTEICR